MGLPFDGGYQAVENYQQHGEGLFTTEMGQAPQSVQMGQEQEQQLMGQQQQRELEQYQRQYQQQQGQQYQQQQQQQIQMPEVQMHELPQVQLHEHPQVQLHEVQLHEHQQVQLHEHHQQVQLHEHPQVQLHEHPHPHPNQHHHQGYAAAAGPMWWEEQPKIEKEWGVWKIACKMRVWELYVSFLSFVFLVPLLFYLLLCFLGAFPRFVWKIWILLFFSSCLTSVPFFVLQKRRY